jgi:hypothetical protein
MLLTMMAMVMVVSLFQQVQWLCMHYHQTQQLDYLQYQQCLLHVKDVTATTMCAG